MADPARLASALAGRYRVERELGAGGMATVYLAEDLKHGRKVAIKVLREDLSASVGAARFLREISIAAQLQHPNILALLDSGEADGLLYYVMPYVEGPSLRSRLSTSGELPVAEAVRLLLEIVDGLATAHQRGVVHRDIKPDNVMLSGRHALITDFGVARAVSAAGSEHTVTSLGVALGTPAYMAPEQATADPTIDHRADIYSVGVLAYELLTGQTPFTANTPQQVLAKHVTEEPDPLSRHRPGISAELEGVVMRCLAKRPADRWQSASELLSALEPLATPSGGTAPTSARIAPARRRSPLVIAAGIIGVAAIAGAVWLGTRPRGTSAEGRSIAVLPFELLSGDSSETAFILGVHGEIVTQLSRVPLLAVASRSSSSGYRGSAKSPRQIAEELGVATLLTGSVQRAGGRVRFQVSLDDAEKGRQIWAESYDRELTAENLFVIQGELAQKVADALQVQMTAGEVADLTVPATHSLEALDLYHAAQLTWYDRIAETDTLVVQSLERAVALDSSFAKAWALLAQLRSWQVRLGVVSDTLPASQALKRAQALAPGSAEALVAAGFYRYYAIGDFVGALGEFESARRALPGSAEVVNAIGLLQRRLGRFDDALASALRSTEMDRRNEEAWTTLGETLGYLGRHGEALQAYERAVALSATNTSAFSGVVLMLISGMGDTATAFARIEAMRNQPGNPNSRYDYGMYWIRRDWPRHERVALAVKAPFGSDGIQYQIGIAMARRLAGDRTGARLFADSAVRAANRELAALSSGNVNPFGRRSIIVMQRGLAHAVAGDSAAAIADAQEAITTYNRTVDAVDGQLVGRLLATVYIFAGRKDDAVKEIRALMQRPVVVTMHDLRLDPMIELLRGHAGFEKLLAEVR